MIEFDETKKREMIIAEAGGTPIGERQGLSWFADPITRSTLILDNPDVTTKNVRRKLYRSRRKFGVPMWLRFCLYLNWRTGNVINTHCEAMHRSQLLRR